MKKLQVFHNLTLQAWKGICQQLWLLAVLSMLFLALTLGAGPVAGSILSQGVDFSGIILGVVTPEGDETGALLEELTGNMRDVRQYCTFRAMSRPQALEALEAGEVTAVLILPEDFLEGVLDGTNPDVTLVVDPRRPVESLLTLWVGQSAADLLTAAQRGIYAVLESYPGQAQAGIPWGELKTQVNLTYINQALNRGEFFRTQELEAAEAMDLEIHYALSLLLFLTMTLPGLLLPAFGSDAMAMRRRLAALGYGAPVQLGSGIWVCFWVILGLTAVPVLYLTGGNVGGWLLLAVFAAGYTGFCCVMAPRSGSCGMLSLILAALCAIASGGLIPPALLPRWLGNLSLALPAEHLRRLLYLPPADWEGTALGMTLLWTALLTGLALLRYHSRLKRGEGAA